MQTEPFQSGESVALPPGGMLLDGDAMWLVRAGSVRLFAVPIGADGAYGKRDYLFDAGEGNVLFGTGAPAAAPGGAGRMAVLATALGATELASLPRSAALGMAADPAARDWLSANLARWLGSWHAALADDAVTANAFALRPNDFSHVPAGEPLRTEGGVLWVRAEHAALCWSVRGRALVVPPGTAFPLADPGKAVADGDAVLSSADTASWWRSDPEWRGLNVFHELALSALLRLREAEAEAERQLLARRSDRDARFYSRAVFRLRNVHRQEPLHAADSDDGDNPLLAAAQAIGRYMGIDVRPPRSQGDAAAGHPVQAIADASRFRIRQIALTGRWWREDNGPLLAFAAEDGRPLALLPRKPGRYDRFDPAEGTRKPLTEAEAGRLQAEAYVFYKPLPLRALKIVDIVRLGAQPGIRKDIAFVLAIGVAVGLLGMFMPVATGILFDTIIPEADRGQLWQMTILLLGATVSVFLFEIARAIAVMRIEGRTDMTIQAAVWDRLLRLPATFFRGYTAGDLAMRAGSINAIRQQLSGIAVSTLFAGLFSSFNLILLFRYDAGLAAIAIGLVAIGIAASAGFAWLQIRNQRELMKEEGKLSGLLFQLLAGIAKFRIAAAESRAFYLWADRFGKMNRIGWRINKLENGFSVYQAVFPLATSMILYDGVVAMGAAPIGTGRFIAFFAAFSSFLNAMLAMSASLLSVMGVVTLVERAKPILQALPEEAEGGEHPGELSGGIELSRVYFRYGLDQPWIVRDLSLTVKPGAFVAIVGETGSGKSTLLRLLLGFEQAESGTIRYGGHELQRLDLQAVRRQMGVVLQHADVMAGDLYSNIVGSTGLTMDDAWEAAQMAGLAEDIRDMPMGMHTVISDGAGTLSGGQRQRLLIARAIVRKPKILLFDEATSALDNGTQAIVSASLERLRATRIVIAHRLSTIRHADLIVVMSRGTIVQAGTYDELMAREGEFAELARRQIM